MKEESEEEEEEEEKLEKSHEIESEKPENSNPPEISQKVNSFIKPPSLHPAGSVRLFPPAGDSGEGGSQPEWMKELNKKNKERREKAAQEEKLAREMEIESVEK